MFSNIGFTEILMVGVIALVLFGPDKLPSMLKMFGKGMKEFKKAMSDVENEIKTTIDTEIAKEENKETK